jgi:hypothetical protein
MLLTRSTPHLFAQGAKGIEALGERLLTPTHAGRGQEGELTAKKKIQNIVTILCVLYIVFLKK